MADCSKKPGEKKVKTSIDLERLKRSPYLVNPIVSPRHGGPGVRVRNHPWLAITAEQPKARANKSPHRDRGAEVMARATTNIYDEDAGKATAKHSGNDDDHQGFIALSRGTEQYFSALECQLRSSGIDENHNSTTAPHIQRKTKFEAHSLQEYYLAGGQLAPYKCSDFLGPVKVQEVRASVLHWNSDWCNIAVFALQFKHERPSAHTCPNYILVLLLVAHLKLSFCARLQTHSRRLTTRRYRQWVHFLHPFCTTSLLFTKNCLPSSTGTHLDLKLTDRPLLASYLDAIAHRIQNGWL